MSSKNAAQQPGYHMQHLGNTEPQTHQGDDGKLFAIVPRKGNLFPFSLNQDWPGLLSQ